MACTFSHCRPASGELGNGQELVGAVLFGFGPDLGAAVVVDVDMDRVGSAADGTVFDIGLRSAFGDIQGNNDLFATAIANITTLVLRGRRTGIASRMEGGESSSSVGSCSPEPNSVQAHSITDNDDSSARR